MSNARLSRHQVLCEAIHKLSLVEFNYRGLKRVVAPYCHGISTRGSEVLRGIQVRGDSSSGNFDLAKLWTVAEMLDLRILDERFAPTDPNYNPDDRGMTQIHCRV